jgi:hypothetical protein
MTRRPAHESLLLELKEQEYAQWKHHPITAAYLQYLSDQVEAFRIAAADLLEEGHLNPQAETLRGRLLMLRELQTLSLDHIKTFYRHEETEEMEETSGTASD